MFSLPNYTETKIRTGLIKDGYGFVAHLRNSSELNRVRIRASQEVKAYQPFPDLPLDILIECFTSGDENSHPQYPPYEETRPYKFREAEQAATTGILEKYVWKLKDQDHARAADELRNILSDLQWNEMDPMNHLPVALISDFKIIKNGYSLFAYLNDFNLVKRMFYVYYIDERNSHSSLLGDLSVRQLIELSSKNVVSRLSLQEILDWHPILKPELVELRNFNDRLPPPDVDGPMNTRIRDFLSNGFQSRMSVVKDQRLTLLRQHKLEVGTTEVVHSPLVEFDEDFVSRLTGHLSGTNLQNVTSSASNGLATPMKANRTSVPVEVGPSSCSSSVPKQPLAQLKPLLERNLILGAQNRADAIQSSASLSHKFGSSIEANDTSVSKSECLLAPLDRPPHHGFGAPFKPTMWSEWTSIKSTSTLALQRSPKIDDISGCGYIGLPNIGNFCYASSVLQVLNSVDEYRDRLINIWATLDKGIDDNVLITGSTCRLLTGMKENEPRGQDSINALYTELAYLRTYFAGKYKNVYKNNMMEDAHQFLLHMLDSLPMNDIYFGFEVILHYIAQCNHNTSSFGTPLPEVCITLYFRDHTFSGFSVSEMLGTEMHSCLVAACTVCGTPRLKQSKIVKTPSYLILNIARFAQDGTKITKDVHVDTSIDIDSFCSEDHKGSTKYNLFAAICHLGASISSGHYVTYALKEEGWFCFDDSSVSQVSSEKLEQSLQQSYVLVYRREVQ